MAADGARTSGIAMMIVAMMMIPIVDGIAKYLSATQSPFFVAWMRYVLAFLVVLPLALRTHGRAIFPSSHLGTHVLRTVFLLTAMTLYFLAIARIPLVQAVSAYFVGPVVATLLSAICLGETLTRRKIISLAVGVSGAFIILGPAGEMESGIILAFGAGVFFAFYLVATRAAAETADPIKTLVFQCLMGVILLAPQGLLFRPDSLTVPEIGLLMSLGSISAVAHLLTITAFRFADASTLAPLVYFEMIGSAIVGLVAFAEVPDRTTLAGASLIMASGLVLTLRSRRHTQGKQ